MSKKFIGNNNGVKIKPVGMVEFMRQFDSGYGDYTKEKYQQPNLTVEEIDTILKNK